MNIAIIAHDKKKELMVQFCIAYSGILSKHNLLATGITGKMVAEATKLNVHRFYSGSQGGDQQIAARLQYNEIDMLLFFRDPITARANEPKKKIFSVSVMKTISLLQQILQQQRCLFTVWKEETLTGAISLIQKTTDNYLHIKKPCLNGRAFSICIILLMLCKV